MFYMTAQTAVNYDYDDDDYELINGEEVVMSAASIPHLKAQGNLYFKIKGYLKGKKCQVFSEAKVVFDDKNWLQPDILVVCDKDKIKDTYIDGTPDFVAEILSLSTQHRDYGIKKDMYEKFGVKEYWIIDPIARNIIVHILENGKYRVDNVYHDFNQREWESLSERQRARQKLTLKISLYDDLEMSVKEIFADD